MIPASPIQAFHSVARISTLAARALWRLTGNAFAPGLTVLLYHGIPRHPDGYGVPAAVFERHLQFLKAHFDLISPDRLEEAYVRGARPRVLVTFDDGFRNNAEVAAPLLRKHQVPALFFVSTAHCQPSRVLWFAYFQALRRCYPFRSLAFRGESFDLSPPLRGPSIDRLQERLLALRPYPTGFVRALQEELPPVETFVPPDILADSFLGMTPAQVAALAADPLFAIGLHTTDHPDLTQCDDSEVRRQIQQNQAWLEEVCGREIRGIAYPLGAYDARTLSACQALGLTRAFAVKPRLCRQGVFETPRFGIYQWAPELLAAKISWGRQLRALGLNVG